MTSDWNSTMRLHPPPELLLATANPGKRREFLRLLPPDLTVLTLTDLAITLPPENELSFAAIADRKATYASLVSGRPALADDSGLVVDALNGDPGIRSARYAGEPPSDARNRAALLAALAEIPSGSRRAQFVCAVTLALDGAVVARALGTCDGEISFIERGENGFGYDSLFVLPSGQTMAELDPVSKNQLSHRAVAYQQILSPLRTTLGLTLSTSSRE